MTTALSRARSWITACVAVATVTALSWNQPLGPPPWVDEGQHIAAAAMLARHGIYGTRNAGRVDEFDPAIQVGPFTIAPIAVAFGIAGVGEVQARSVSVVLSLATAVLVWRAARRLVGERRAIVVMGMVLAGGGDAFSSFAFVGRQVLGEVPAIGWLVAAFLASTRPHRRGMVPAAVAGLCLGAAFLTKGQLLIVVPPALFVTWLADRCFYRQREPFEIPVVLATALALVVTWQAIQWGALGPEQYTENARVLQRGLHSQVLAFEAGFRRNALASLWRGGALWWLPVAAIGLWRRVRERSAGGYLHAWMGAVWTGLLLWFLLLSVGWSRYALYGVMLAPIWFVDAGADMLQTLRRQVRARRVADALAIAVLAVVCVLQSRDWLPRIASPSDNGLTEMRALVARHVPAGAVVETWEWEFLTDERVVYSHPPLEVMYAVTPAVQLGRPLPGDVYNARWASPQFLLHGPFGGWTGVYEATLAHDAREVGRAGRYVLYELAATSRSRGERR